MKFNHLQASIRNNADQEPSLYLALCMVESLFSDVEDSCGTEISRCPVGDERLPAKLVWLCRFINDAYHDNSDDLQRGRARLDTAMEKLKDTQEELEDCAAVAERLAALKTELSALNEKLQARNAAAEECKRLNDECDRAKQKLEALSRFDPAAAKAELEKLSCDIAEQESTKAALSDQLSQAKQKNTQLQTKCNALTLDISHKKAENEALSERLTRSQEDLDAQQLEKERLNSELSDCLKKLDALQAEVKRLNGEVPEARELLQQEQQRQEKLSQSVGQLQSQSITLQSENEEQAVRLQKLEADVKQKQDAYDTLTASCIARSEELKRLEQQIAELRNNDDEKKREIYRKQLEDNQRKLKEIQQDCSRIEQENTQAQEKLEAGQSQYEGLLEQKRRHDSESEKLKKQLRELQFADTEEYVHEVAALEERVKQLEFVRGKLSATIDGMHKILGSAPIDENASLEERMKDDLLALRLRSEALRAALVNCAKSVKMEELK